MTNNQNSPQNPAAPTATAPTYPEFQWIDTVSSLLDNKFRIPFTQIRFGADFLVGLIPTVGDWLSPTKKSAPKRICVNGILNLLSNKDDTVSIH